MENIASYLLGQGGVLSIVAEKLTIASIEVKRKIELGVKGGSSYFLEERKEYLGADVGIYSDGLEFEVGELEMRAVAVIVKGDVKGKVNRMNVEAVEEEYKREEERRTEKRGDLFTAGRKTYEHKYDRIIRQRTAKVVVGGDLEIDSQEEVNIVGDIEAQNIIIHSGGVVNIEGTQESQEHSEEKHEEKISGLKFGKGLSLEQKRTVADHNEKQRQSYVKKTQLNAIEKLEIVAPEVTLEGIDAKAGEINIESDILKMNPMLEQQLKIMLDKEEEQTLRFKITNALADTTDAVKANKETLQAIDKANNELYEINKLHKEGKASDMALSDAETNLAVLIASEVTMALKVAKGVATVAASIGVLGFYISAEVESKVEEIVRGSSAYKFVLNTLQAREVNINVINGILKAQYTARNKW
jgi:hypothetical protein